MGSRDCTLGARQQGQIDSHLLCRLVGVTVLQAICQKLALLVFNQNCIYNEQWVCTSVTFALTSGVHTVTVILNDCHNINFSFVKTATFAVVLKSAIDPWENYLKCHKVQLLKSLVAACLGGMERFYDVQRLYV